MIKGVIYLELEKEKKILNEMIDKGEDYNIILKQSQKVDKLINRLIYCRHKKVWQITQIVLQLSYNITFL